MNRTKTKRTIDHAWLALELAVQQDQSLDRALHEALGVAHESERAHRRFVQSAYRSSAIKAAKYFVLREVSEATGEREAKLSRLFGIRHDILLARIFGEELWCRLGREQVRVDLRAALEPIGELDYVRDLVG